MGRSEFYDGLKGEALNPEDVADPSLLESFMPETPFVRGPSSFVCRAPFFYSPPLCSWGFRQSEDCLHYAVQSRD